MVIAYPVRILHKDQAERIIESIGVEDSAVPLLAPKATYNSIILKTVKTSWANIIKQEMLACGGDAAVHRKSYNCSEAHSDVLLMGSSSCFVRFLKKMNMQPECFSELTKEIERVVRSSSPFPRIAGKNYDLTKEHVIFGILNITPNSFSDGGKYLKFDDAFNKAEELLEHGANFIDVGGESTRPNSARVSLQEEQDRVLPIVEAITRKFGPVVSIDSYKPEVLREALKAGAKVINDVSNGSAVHVVAKDIADNDATAIVMMNRSQDDISGSTPQTDSADPIADFISFCHETRMSLEKLGVDRNRLIMDPGIGFGLSDSDINNMINNAYSISGSGFATCWGISRKSFIGRTTGLEVDNRDMLSNAISLYLLTQGVKIFRTHDVAGLSSVIKFYTKMEEA